MNRPAAKLRRQHGGMMVLIAGLLIVLTGFAVLAIDVGRILYIRNELQNVADAAALAGANCLDKQTKTGTTDDCVATQATSLNWTTASAKAVTTLGRNTADNRAVSTVDSGHVVDYGYWNLLTGAPTGGSMSTTPAAITVNDKPAIRVTVTKDTGKNNGPITMLTRIMFGGSDVPMSASAVAVRSSPGSAAAATIIPQVINKCMFDRYWDSSTGQPVLFKSTDTDPVGVPQQVGMPWNIRIGSSYHYPLCDAGQWTSFEMSPNASNLATVIQNGNGTALSIGSTINLLTGTVNSGYNNLSDKYPTLPVNTTVVVVNVPSLQGGTPTIFAFAGFQITSIQGGSDKYIEGHFIPSVVTPGASGIGPFYGTYTPPRLAQ